MLHEPAEGESSARLEGARRLAEPAEVREHLVRGVPERESGFRAVSPQKLLERHRDRLVGTPAVEVVEEGKPVPDRPVHRPSPGSVVAVQLQEPGSGGPQPDLRMAFPEEEEVLVRDREQRTPEGRVDAQFVLGKLDGGKGRPEERQFRAADVGLHRRQRVGDAEILEGVGVGLGHEPPVVPEPPEEQADVARFHPPRGTSVRRRDLETPIEKSADELRDRLRLVLLEVPKVGGVRQRDGGERRSLSRLPESVERHVVHLPREASRPRARFKRRPQDLVHEVADAGNRTEVRGQADLGGAAGEQPLFDAEIVAHIGPPESVDGLLGVPDQAEPAGTRDRLVPVAVRRLFGGEQQDDLRLHRVGVLVFVYHEVAESTRQFPANLRVVPEQASRPEEQVVEVEKARLRFCALVVVHQPAEVLPQEGGEVRIALPLERGEPGPEGVTPLSGVGEAGWRAAAIRRDPELRERLLEPVQISSGAGFPRPDLPGEIRGGGERADQPVGFRARRVLRERPVELLEHEEGRARFALPAAGLIDQLQDRGLRIPGAPLPRRVEGSVVEEPQAGLVEDVERAHHRVPAAAQQAADARSRSLELPVDEMAEDPVEEGPLLGVRQDPEVGVHPGLDGALPQDGGAKGVDGPDGRLLDLGERRFEARSRGCPFRAGRRAFDPGLEALPDSEPQFTGGFLREGDRGDLPDPGGTRGHHFHHPVDNRRGLPRAGRRLHDQRGVVVPADALPGRGVRQYAHGRLRIPTTSSRAAANPARALVRACPAGRGPQTGR